MSGANLLGSCLLTAAHPLQTRSQPGRKWGCGQRKYASELPYQRVN